MTFGKLALLTASTALVFGCARRPELGVGAASRSGALVTGVARGPLQNIRQVGGVSAHACAILLDGTVACWGANSSGQLGDGTFIDSATPVVVPGLSGVIGLSVGRSHTCAVLSNATAVCWGDNSNGRLGNGTLVSSSPTPVAVVGLSGVKAVTAGGTHSCALRQDGTARCWGLNFFGELGDGTTNDSPTPVTVSGLSGVVSLSAGTGSACAVLADGTARCWGLDTQGQLGDHGTTESTPLPVVVAGLAGAETVSVGNTHACAKLTNGSVSCWGDPSAGDPTGFSNVVSLAAGVLQTCVVRADGTVWCVGSNTFGSLGMVGPDASVPVMVPGLTGAVSIASSSYASCATLSDGTARCWGGGDRYGQLGDGVAMQWPSPQQVPGLTGVLSIASGASHNCGTGRDGTARCWGSNDRSQLGDGTTVASSTPVVVAGLSSIHAIAAGLFHTCALLFDQGAVRCWSLQNFDVVLGNGSMTGSATPVSVVGLGPASRLVAASRHTCATVVGGTWCWGDNRHGEMGSGAMSFGQATPTAISGAPSIASLAIGRWHMCAATTTGGVLCWGDNELGQLGVPGITGSPTPVAVPGLTNVISVAATPFATCAVLGDGSVRCWGDVSFNAAIGEILQGEGDPTPVVVPGLANVRTLAGGEHHMCAGLTDGTAWCWGQNREGQLGNGTRLDTVVPTKVIGLAGVVSLAAGGGDNGSHTCATLTDDSVSCWGLNDVGQIGRPVPLMVVTPQVVLGGACGDGIVQVGETCDPPNGSTCSARCQAAPATGACVSCERLSPENRPGGACEPDKLTSPASGGYGCAGFPGGQGTSCAALVQCIRNSRCAEQGPASNPVLSCYCGSASLVTCSGSGPAADSPCRAAYEAADGTTNVATILGDFSNVSVPVGVANNLALCDVAAGCTNLCADAVPDAGSPDGGSTSSGDADASFGVDASFGGDASSDAQPCTPAAGCASQTVSSCAPGACAEIRIQAGPSPGDYVTVLVQGGISVPDGGVGTITARPFPCDGTPPLQGGYKIVDTNLGDKACWEIAFSANVTYTADANHPITVCLGSTVLVQAQEPYFVYHDEGGGFIDRTGYPDWSVTPPMICGSVQSLSPFALVTRIDKTRPVLSNVPADKVVYATSTAGAKVTYAQPTAVDAVDGPLSVTCTTRSGATFPLGKTVVTCSASDASTNTASATFTVWVQVQAPTDGSFFLLPVRANGSSIFRVGRPVPLRFKLTGASSGITNLTAKLVVTKISSAVQGTTEDASDETVDDTDFVFKYRPLLKWYAYRWRTRDQAQGTYRLRADLGDGVTHQINVSLKAPR